MGMLLRWPCRTLPLKVHPTSSPPVKWLFPLDVGLSWRPTPLAGEESPCLPATSQEHPAGHGVTQHARLGGRVIQQGSWDVSITGASLSLHLPDADAAGGRGDP